MRNDIIHIIKTHDAVTIAASGSSTSEAIELTKAANDGFFSTQYVVTGTGTCKVDYLCSNDGTNYSIPTGASAIQEGITAGNAIEGFSPPLCKWIKIKFTETGGANAVVVTNNVAVQ